MKVCHCGVAYVEDTIYGRQEIVCVTDDEWAAAIAHVDERHVSARVTQLEWWPELVLSKQPVIR